MQTSEHIPTFYSFIVSLMICMALVPPLGTLASRLRIVDIPGDRKLHMYPVARVGGLPLAVGAFTAILMWAPPNNLVVASLIGGLIILAFGVWDDKAGLSYRTKFVGQLVAAIIVVWWGGAQLTTLPLFSDETVPFWLSLPLTLLVLVGVTNAVNLADGLDGLAGGLAFLSLAGMAYFAHLSKDSVLLLMIVPMLGGLLGFLRFNTYPARIFLGDAGSQLLGFFMGVSVIVLTDESRGPYSPSLGLLLLGLPLLDTLGVMIQRLLERRSPFVADRNHIHHKLLAIGFSHDEAVIIIYVVQATMVTLAYLLRWQTDFLILAVYLSIAAVVLSCFILAGRGHFHLERSQIERYFRHASLARLVRGQWVTRMPLRLLDVMIPLFLVVSVFFPRHVPEDIAYFALTLFGVVLVGIYRFPQWASFFVRGGLYVGSTFLMYLSEQASTGSGSHVQIPLNVFFAVIAVLVVLTIRFNDAKRFHTTPLDYLMVFLALVIPVLPELHVGETNLGFLTAKLLVLFFSYELLLHAFSERVIQYGLVSLWLLFGLIIRAWS